MVAAIGIGFVLLATGAVFAGVATGKASALSGTETGAGQAAKRELPGSVPAGQGLKTCSISRLASSSRLKTLFGTVYDADTKQVVWTKTGDQQSRPANTVQILVAAAALAELGPDYQMTTTVELGNAPGTVVLVGHGDATLSRLPTGQNSVYAGSAHLDALAKTASAAYYAQTPDVPLTHVILDDTFWDDSDSWNDDWPRSLQTGGSLSEVTALQIDGDRKDPKAQTSPRGTDPVQRAGDSFAAALNQPDITTTKGASENGATVLATAKSQPVKVLVKQMLATNDNTLAEMLARVTSQHAGKGGTAASLPEVLSKALEKYNVPTADVTLVDGSGESPADAVTTDYMASFLDKVHDKSNNLNLIYDALPVAGKSGGLASRFVDTSSVAQGHVHAGPGAIDSAVGLSGIVSAKDGSALTFAFFAVRDGIAVPDAQKALDALTTAVYRCGKNLTTN